MSDAPDGRAIAAALYGREPEAPEPDETAPERGVWILHPILGRRWLCGPCYEINRMVVTVVGTVEDLDSAPPWGADCVDHCGRQYGMDAP